MIIHVAEDADGISGRSASLEVKREAVLSVNPPLPDGLVPTHLLHTQGWVIWVCLEQDKGFSDFMPYRFRQHLVRFLEV